MSILSRLNFHGSFIGFEHGLESAVREWCVGGFLGEWVRAYSESVDERLVRSYACVGLFSEKPDGGISPALRR